MLSGRRRIIPVKGSLLRVAGGGKERGKTPATDQKVLQQ